MLCPDLRPLDAVHQRDKEIIDGIFKIELPNKPKGGLITTEREGIFKLQEQLNQLQKDVNRILIHLEIDDKSKILPI